MLSVVSFNSRICYIQHYVTIFKNSSISWKSFWSSLVKSSSVTHSMKNLSTISGVKRPSSNSIVRICRDKVAAASRNKWFWISFKLLARRLQIQLNHNWSSNLRAPLTKIDQYIILIGFMPRRMIYLLAYKSAQSNNDLTRYIGGIAKKRVYLRVAERVVKPTPVQLANR